MTVNKVRLCHKHYKCKSSLLIYKLRYYNIAFILTSTVLQTASARHLDFQDIVFDSRMHLHVVHADSSEHRCLHRLSHVGLPRIRRIVRYESPHFGPVRAISKVVVENGALADKVNDSRQRHAETDHDSSIEKLLCSTNKTAAYDGKNNATKDRASHLDRHSDDTSLVVTGKRRILNLYGCL